MVSRRNVLIGALIGLTVGALTVTRMVGHSTPTAVLSPNASSPSLTIAKAQNLTGRKLPDATFTDFNGAKTTFAALRGKPVVVNTWSWSCTPCIEEMPAFERVFQANKGRVEFVGMDSAGDGEAKAREFAGKTGVTYPLWRDEDAVYATAFKVASLPMTLIADANGTVVWSRAGRLSEADLIEKLRELAP